MSDNNEVALARQDERVLMITAKLNEMYTDQREMGNRLEQMFIILSNMENRVKVLEEGSEKNEDLANELISLKHEMAGAKKVIKGMWWTLSGIVALGLALKQEITKWLS